MTILDLLEYDDNVDIQTLDDINDDIKAKAEAALNMITYTESNTKNAEHIGELLRHMNSGILIFTKSICFLHFLGSPCTEIFFPQAIEVARISKCTD